MPRLSAPSALCASAVITILPLTVHLALPISWPLGPVALGMSMMRLSNVYVTEAPLPVSLSKSCPIISAHCVDACCMVPLLTPPSFCESVPLLLPVVVLMMMVMIWPVPIKTVIFARKACVGWI